ncbi:hypothetical protein ACFCXR_12710 [Streptomyces noursei]|uniref:CRISPR-associated endonuclease Cas2 n=1 Tax=Streptomyces noursei TaxID=1971 RepID=UPI0035DF95CB
MCVVVVYDTAAERNPRTLRTCRQYLHHVQHSVFEGHLAETQLYCLQTAVEHALDLSYDKILVHRFLPVPPRYATSGAQPSPHPLTLFCTVRCPRPSLSISASLRTRQR